MDCLPKIYLSIAFTVDSCVLHTRLQNILVFGGARRTCTIRYCSNRQRIDMKSSNGRADFHSKKIGEVLCMHRTGAAIGIRSEQTHITTFERAYFRQDLLAYARREP